MAGAGEENVVYAVLMSAPALVYKSRQPEHKHPVIIKVGKAAGSLFRRLREHHAAGFKTLAVLAVIRKPPEGVHNCEKRIKNMLKDFRLRVGTVRGGQYKPALECYQTTWGVMHIIHDVAREYPSFQRWHVGKKPQLVAVDIILGMVAPDGGDHEQEEGVEADKSTASAAAAGANDTAASAEAGAAEKSICALGDGCSFTMRDEQILKSYNIAGGSVEAKSARAIIELVREQLRRH